MLLNRSTGGVDWDVVHRGLACFTCRDLEHRMDKRGWWPVEFLGWDGGDAVFLLSEPWRGYDLLGECCSVYFQGQDLPCAGARRDGERITVYTRLRPENDTLDEVLS